MPNPNYSYSRTVQAEQKHLLLLIPPFFFFSFLSAKVFSTLFHSSASRKSVVFSAPHSDTVVLLAGPNRMKCYAFFFFFLSLNIDFTARVS